MCDCGLAQRCGAACTYSKPRGSHCAAMYCRYGRDAENGGHIRASCGARAQVQGALEGVRLSGAALRAPGRTPADPRTAAGRLHSIWHRRCHAKKRRGVTCRLRRIAQSARLPNAAVGSLPQISSTRRRWRAPALRRALAATRCVRPAVHAAPLLQPMKWSRKIQVPRCGRRAPSAPPRHTTPRPMQARLTRPPCPPPPPSRRASAAAACCKWGCSSARSPPGSCC